jgi:flagellar hook-associated protein 2
MATLSSPGIGSGLDVRSLVTQLMAVERAPLTALQTSTRRTQDQLSAYGRMQSAMSTLRDAARKLATESTFNATTVANSNPTALTVASDGSTPAGTYSVAVSKLATAQTISSSSSWATSSDTVGPGTLTIELGSWNAGQTSFTAKPGATAVAVRIDSGSDSLSQVRDAINASGAGVTASIVNDANGARLAIRSSATGAENGFRISVNDDDGDNSDPGGLSQLAFDPSALPAPITQMTRRLAAGNAEATVNGVPVSSATNALDNVLDGLSLKLGQVTTTPVDLTINRDSASIKKSVTDFATAYNDLVKLVRDQTRVTEGAAAGGVLQGDASAKGLVSQMRSLAGGSTAAAVDFTRLADVGLEPQSDGTLKVNDTKLERALGKLDALKSFFTRDDVGTDSDGFAAQFKSFGDARLGNEGFFETRNKALQNRVTNNTDKAARLEARLALTEKRLTEQYSRLDTNLSNLTSLQSLVTQQINSFNRSSR